MRLPSAWFLIVEPIDLRCGMDRLLVWVQQSGGAVSGSVGYAFRNRAGSRIKLLLIDGTGAWLGSLNLQVQQSEQRLPSLRPRPQPAFSSRGFFVVDYSSARAMSLSRVWLTVERSVPFGKNCLSRPLVFSLLPRCQGA